jgi:predicted DCC family thiol-disulfide oxidoreductase YuxK
MNNIVFYDGECGLCQRSISLLSALDTKKKLSFAPLNGPTYLEIFKSVNGNIETVIFYSNGVIFERSEAIIEAISSLGGWKKSICLLRIIPRFM